MANGDPDILKQSRVGSMKVINTRTAENQIVIKKFKMVHI